LAAEEAVLWLLFPQEMRAMAIMRMKKAVKVFPILLLIVFIVIPPIFNNFPAVFVSFMEEGREWQVPFLPKEKGINPSLNRPPLPPQEF